MNLNILEEDKVFPKYIPHCRYPSMSVLSGILVRNSEGKTPLGKPRYRRWVDKIKISVR
jgi:hypothetical protein